MIKERSKVQLSKKFKIYKFHFCSLKYLIVQFWSLLFQLCQLNPTGIQIVTIMSLSHHVVQFLMSVAYEANMVWYFDLASSQDRLAHLICRTHIIYWQCLICVTNTWWRIILYDFSALAVPTWPNLVLNQTHKLNIGFWR